MPATSPGTYVRVCVCVCVCVYVFVRKYVCMCACECVYRTVYAYYLARYLCVCECVCVCDTHISMCGCVGVWVYTGPCMPAKSPGTYMCVSVYVCVTHT